MTDGPPGTAQNRGWNWVRVRNFLSCTARSRCRLHRPRLPERPADDASGHGSRRPASRVRAPPRGPEERAERAHTCLSGGLCLSGNSGRDGWSRLAPWKADCRRPITSLMMKRREAVGSPRSGRDVRPDGRQIRAVRQFSRLRRLPEPGGPLLATCWSSRSFGGCPQTWRGLRRCRASNCPAGRRPLPVY